MAWRAMNSLLTLRAQANALAPNRSKASDGLVGDEDHQQNNPGSGHNPHPVEGVGPEMVTAFDLTHDPVNGMDSYRFSEVLREHRDPRIYYVISNRRIFSSYATSSRKAWEWGPYSGSDPHTNHSHNQVKDAPISDTSTPWNLEGYSMASQFNAEDLVLLRAAPWQYAGNGMPGVPSGKSTLYVLGMIYSTVMLIAEKMDEVTPEEIAAMQAAAEAGAMAAIDDIVAAVIAAIPDDAVLTKADVEAAVRSVFADAGTADQ